MGLVLSEAQTRRLYGLSHLEGGKDPLIIVDELLSRDAELRGTYKLSMKDTRLVAGFLKAAAERGWRTTSNPNILTLITHLWKCGVQRLEPEIAKALAEIVEKLWELGWDPAEFVAEAADARSLVNYYFRFKRGELSLEEFRRRVAPFS
ncbi:MAG: hypothetical protein QXG97_02725 [Nitrososphaerota archaeon]